MSTSPPILGLDIGGANLKAAATDRRAASVGFPLWKHPDRLPAALAELVAPFADCDEIAVTMTGELCDCFETKRDGVHAIIKAVRNVSRSRAIHVWSTDGRFLNSEEAKEQYLKVASANWHALATFAGSYSPRGVGLLVDIGTTTTDIIPLVDGFPRTEGHTDTERIHHGELVYTGVRRTPATTLLGVGYYAAEFFATVHDAYVVLGELPEDESDYDTADGRPATKRYAHARLSRMMCGDPELIEETETQKLAKEIVYAQSRLLDRKLRAFLPWLAHLKSSTEHPARTVIVCGSGEFLAWRLVDALSANERNKEFDRTISLSERLGPELSACAPAYAVAILAKERRG